jgi:hypothetical protein
VSAADELADVNLILRVTDVCNACIRARGDRWSPTRLQRAVNAWRAAGLGTPKAQRAALRQAVRTELRRLEKLAGVGAARRVLRREHDDGRP